MNAYMRRWVSVLLCASALSAAAGAEPAQHVVSLGGDVTEIVYALGEQGRLACDDQTSLYPPEAAKPPPGRLLARAVRRGCAVLPT